MNSLPGRIIISFLLILSSCGHENMPALKVFRDEPIPWDHKAPCRIIYETGNKKINLEGNIKVRGGLSSRYAKHSYSLELNEKIDLCGLPSDDDWIINANYIDKTFMRHKISYDLFREMGSNNIAPQCAFAEVYLNEVYNGLYVIMEEVNGGMVRLEKDDSMAMIFKDPPVFIQETLTWLQEPGNYYQQKFPRIEERDMTYVMDEMREFLYYSSDGEFVKNIDQWFDIENVIDWHILLMFSNNGDAVRKNFYLYKLNSRTPFRFAIWDYDHTFGRDGDNEMNMMERELDCERSVLIKRLVHSEYPDYKSRVAEKYFYLRKKNILSLENFWKHIEKNDRLIRNYTDRNFEKWPLDEKWYYDDNNYQQELDIMLEFVALRLDYLDNYFQDWLGKQDEE